MNHKHLLIATTVAQIATTTSAVAVELRDIKQSLLCESESPQDLGKRFVMVNGETQILTIIDVGDAR